jgi:putative nucleotidyltransferase with HDIG domain
VSESEYFQIPANFYHSDEIIDRDLFILYQGQYLLFRPKNLVWKAEDSQRLEQFNVKSLWVRASTRDEHYLFLESNLSRILQQKKISRAEKTQILFETSEQVVGQIFNRPNSPEAVKRSVSLIKNSLDFLKNKENFHELMKFAATDFSEYAHAIQSAAYSIALAQRVGLTSFNDLSAIGVGSILHDLGKSKIDRRILEKEEALSDDERQEIRRHPEYGFDILKKTRAIPELSELIVLQHHERPGGRGYPHGLDTDIVLCAKIVAITDCFDSLTSDRPWVQKLASFKAIQMMRTDLAMEYDQNLVLEFIKVLGVK